MYCRQTRYESVSRDNHEHQLQTNDEVLHYSRADHRCGPSKEAESNALQNQIQPSEHSGIRGLAAYLQRRKVDTDLAKSGVDDEIEDGDEEDEREWVQVRQDVIGDDAVVQGGSLGDQIVVDF